MGNNKNYNWIITPAFREEKTEHEDDWVAEKEEFKPKLRQIVSANN